MDNMIAASPQTALETFGETILKNLAAYQDLPHGIIWQPIPSARQAVKSPPCPSAPSPMTS